MNELTIETSADIGELAKALPAAQAAIEAITRDAANPHFNSRYASLTEIAEAVLPAMNSNGFAVLQGVTAAGSGVTVTTRLLHTSAQWLQSTHLVPVSRQDAQGVGSALTYARRQALQALFCVAPQGEDDDGEGAVGRGSGRPPLPPAEPKRPAGRAERVQRLEKTVRDVKTVRDLDRAVDLAKGLRGELAAEEPAEAARLDALIEERRAELLQGAG